GSVTDYIRSDDVKVIVNESVYVFRISVEDIVFQSLSGDRGMYDCTVLETIKGKDGKEITTALFILPFPKIESGTEYIVAVSPLDNVFIISSKHSVFDPSEYETIKGLID
ncbi:MAG: hypothetical protein IKX86_03435, partial [Clostridia bacterium]|nr:hypothetical protein [Clostridia bacterium]